MNEGVAAVGGGAGILHAAGDEFIDHDLRVFFPGVVDAKFLAEQLHHGRRAAIVYREAVAASLGRVIGDGDAAPSVFHLVEFTGYNSDQIGGAGDGLFPIPGFQSFSGVADADELAVRNGDPGSGNRKDCFGREPIVGVVVGRQVVTRVFGFALGPNLLWAVRVIFVRKNEVDAFGGFAFVTDGDVEFLSRLGGSRKRNNQFVGGSFEFRGGFVEGHALNVEADGVESDFRGAAAQNRERVRDFAEKFFLVKVEAQGNLRMLQII